jgi:hypothetical protein
MRVDIYIPEEEFRIPSGLVVTLIMLASVLIAGIVEAQGLRLSFDPIWFAIVGLLASGVAIAVLHAKRKPLTDRLRGYIEFHNDGLIINGQRLAYVEIDKVSMRIDDYRGKKVRMGRSSYISEGVDNYITFNHAGRRVKSYFQLKTFSDTKELYPAVRELIRLGRIPFLRGLDVLGIDDYAEIQEFKKSLK